jgi:hypothetical protein
MERLDHHGDWTYLDEFKQLWRLARTGSPESPFQFMLLEKDVDPMNTLCTCLSISRDPLCFYHGDKSST